MGMELVIYITRAVDMETMNKLLKDYDNNREKIEEFYENRFHTIYWCCRSYALFQVLYDEVGYSEDYRKLDIPTLENVIRALASMHEERELVFRTWEEKYFLSEEEVTEGLKKSLEYVEVLEKKGEDKEKVQNLKKQLLLSNRYIFEDFTSLYRELQEEIREITSSIEMCNALLMILKNKDSKEELAFMFG